MVPKPRRRHTVAVALAMQPTAACLRFAVHMSGAPEMGALLMEAARINNVRLASNLRALEALLLGRSSVAEFRSSRAANMAKLGRLMGLNAAGDGVVEGSIADLIMKAA